MAVMGRARVLLAALCLALFAASAMASIQFPTPILSAQTVPVLQWKQVVNRTLAAAATTSMLSDIPSPVFTSAAGADGTGLFLVSGATSSRHRAADGGTSWVDSLASVLPAGSTCGSPYLPPGNANHLFVLCSPSIIVKRWYDTGVIQFAVTVHANYSTPLANSGALTDTADTPVLTQIVGISTAYSPPVLVLGSSESGAVVLIDTVRGSFVGSFSTPPSPFLSLVSARAFLLDPAGDTNRTVVLAHATTKTSTCLIAFRVNLVDLTINGAYETLLTDTNTNGAHTVTLLTPSKRLFVRTSSALVMVDGSTSWSLDLDPTLFFPLSAQVIESSTGRYLLPSVLTTPRSDVDIVLRGVDSGVSPPVAMAHIDFADLLAPSEAPLQVLLDDNDDLILINSNRIAALTFNLSAPDVTGYHLPSRFTWTFVLFEDWTGVASDGSTAGNMSIGSFAAHPELTRIVSTEYLADMLTGTSFVLVRANTSVDGSVAPWEFTETLFAFTTHESPSCNETADGECEACAHATGQTTARQCAYCRSTGMCDEFLATDTATELAAICTDLSFADGIDICNAHPGSTFPLLLALLLPSIMLLLIMPLVYLIRRNRRARTPAETLRLQYQSLSPDPSFSHMRSMSPRARPTPNPSASPRPMQHLQQADAERMAML